MRNKSPSELTSKTIRINIDIYRVLLGLSLRDNITMSEALTKLITGAAFKEPVSPAQIPLPVTAAKPVPIFVAKPMLTFRVTPPPAVMAVNGNKAGIFVVKPKGGILND
ncbi:hypothetical protein ES705_45539 [subsurface metagenome]